MRILDMEMPGSCKLAICVPTYNNPAFINDILTEELPCYTSNNMVLYIMDSSENNETEHIVREAQRQFRNLFYHRFPSDIHSNKKVYLTFQMAGKEIPCDYMWIRSDATRASKNFLEALPFYLARGYDFVVASYEGAYPKGIWETSEPQAIFDEYAWRLCLYGAAIVKTESMLIPARWAYLEDRYLAPERINCSHVAFYFEQMLHVKEFRALIMGLPLCLYHLTPKKKKSTWHRDIFKMWLDVWPNAIEALPEYYARKLEAIRDFGINVHYYYMPMLRSLAQDGILTPGVYEKYKDKFIRYANMPLENFHDAAYGLPNERDHVGQEAYYTPLCLNLFRDNYKRRYIYGCGKAAQGWAKRLCEHGIAFSAFLVSRREEADEKKEFMGHRVVALEDCELFDGCGILLGLNLAHQEEVIALLRTRGLLKYVYRVQGSHVSNMHLVETVAHHALTKEMEDWT